MKNKTFLGLPLLLFIKLAASLILNIAGRVLENYILVSDILFVLAALIAGYDLLIEAAEELIKKNFFDEDILIVLVAAAAAFVDEMEEAATIIFLFQLGECVQSISFAYCMKKINRVAADHFGMEDYGNERKLMKTFSSIYTPCMLGCALLFGILYAVMERNLSNAIYRGLVIIVAACPCAIVISVPLAYSAGIASAAEKNIFFKGDKAVDAAASSKNASALKADEAYDRCLSVRLNGENQDVLAIVRRNSAPDACDRVYTSAKKIRSVALQNMFIALILKVAVVFLGIIGKCPVWFAVFADAGISLITIANALRLLSFPLRSRKIRL